jgi:RimJ/RimL family protein N-acetyltransferase
MTLPTPDIECERLILSVVKAPDAPDIVGLLNTPEASANTLSIDHPYSLADAEEFVDQVGRGVEAGEKITFLARRMEDRRPVGTIGITIEPEHQRAELGYIIGRDHCNNGYATEAGRGVLGYCFDTLGLHKVTAAWFADNPASGRVLEKLGFEHEGMEREQYHRGGFFRDSVNMGLLRRDYVLQQQRSAKAEETTK